MLARIVDLFAPVGLGQRALVYAPPGAGLTGFFRAVSAAVAQHHEDIKCISLLLDERPEEVTRLRQEDLHAEVVASTFDESPGRHIQIVDMVIENARRTAESGKNVVLLVDSLTRLARASRLESSEGTPLPGGLPASVLLQCRRLLGTGRKLSGRGSVTLLAALRESDAAFDRHLALELEDTANCIVHLTEEECGLDLERSRTRHAERLRSAEELATVEALRARLREHHDTGELYRALKASATNAELIAALAPPS